MVSCCDTHDTAEREKYAEYTDMQEPYGIDECWLDVTGSSSLKVQLINVNSKMRKNLFYFLTKKGRTFPLVKISFLKDIDSLGS